MRASSGFLPGRTLSTPGRCRSQLRPAVGPPRAVPRAAVAGVVVTSDRRDHHRLLVAAVGASSSTPTSSVFSPSLPPFPRGPPDRSTPFIKAAAAAAIGGAEYNSSSSNSSSSDADSSPSTFPSLVLYSKRDCPLCQGLEEKVRAALARGAFLPGSKLKGISLEVRDIEENAEWAAAFATEVPVLFWKNREDGKEEETMMTPIPRSPPRVTVEKLSTVLEAAMPLD